jgi:hypothetical protein
MGLIKFKFKGDLLSISIRLPPLPPLTESHTK